MAGHKLKRREFCRSLVVTTLSMGLSKSILCAESPNFKLKYIIPSSMYGRMKLSDILPEVRKTGAKFIDIWPEPHANHREQIENIGHIQFTSMLKKYQVKLGMMTRFDLGPFALKNEIQIVRKLGGSMIVCGSRGHGNLEADVLKVAVKEFAEKMKPHIAAAEETGVIIGIENHRNSLIESPESMLWLAEFTISHHIGIALAPYHLPQDPELIAKLIEDLGSKIVHFYAWQYGMGCHEKLPKEQELLQLPGRGKLDFLPIISALHRIKYTGWTEIFMHPVPRGIPILPTAEQITAEINRSRKYLDACVNKLL